MTDLVDSYADLAITLSPPHGPDSCFCLICSDARKALGHRPLTPDLDGIVDRWYAARPSFIAVWPCFDLSVPILTRSALMQTAARIHRSPDEIVAHRTAGDIWCSGCKDWHAPAAFNPSQTKGYCRDFHTKYQRQRREQVS